MCHNFQVVHCRGAIAAHGHPPRPSAPSPSSSSPAWSRLFILRPGQAAMSQLRRQHYTHRAGADQTCSAAAHLKGWALFSSSRQELRGETRVPPAAAATASTSWDAMLEACEGRETSGMGVGDLESSAWAGRAPVSKQHRKPSSSLISPRAYLYQAGERPSLPSPRRWCKGPRSPRRRPSCTQCVTLHDRNNVSLWKTGGAARTCGCLAAQHGAARAAQETKSFLLDRPAWIYTSIFPVTWVCWCGLMARHSH